MDKKIYSILDDQIHNSLLHYTNLLQNFLHFGLLSQITFQDIPTNFTHLCSILGSFYFWNCSPHVNGHHKIHIKVSVSLLQRSHLWHPIGFPRFLVEYQPTHLLTIIDHHMPPAQWSKNINIHGKKKKSTRTYTNGAIYF